MQRIIERQSRKRMRPRSARALERVTEALEHFAGAVAFDYAQTHTDTFHPMKPDVVSLLTQWLDSRDTEDSERVYVSTESEDGPALTGEAESLADGLARVRDADREVLEPELVAAIDDFILASRREVGLASISNEWLSGSQLERQAQESIVIAVRDLTTVFAADSTRPLRLSSRMLEELATVRNVRKLMSDERLANGQS